MTRKASLRTGRWWLGAAAWIVVTAAPLRGAAPEAPTSQPSATTQPAAATQPSEASGESSEKASSEAETGTWLDAVVITASRKETRQRDLPASSIVIDQPHLRRPDAKNFLDVLSDQPGIKVTSRQDGGIFGAGIEVRGFNTNSMSGGNVLILLDGIPQRRLSFGGPYMGAIPYDAVTRMELVKGPLSMQYGRGSLAGALQLFTDPGSDTFGGVIQTTYDTAAQDIRSFLRLRGPVPGMKGSTFSLTTSGGYSEGWQERAESGDGFLYLHTNLRLTEKDDLKIIAGYYRGCEHVAAPVLIDNHGHRLPGIDRDTNLGVPGQNSISLTEYRLGTAWTHHYDDTFRHKFTLAYWYGDTQWEVGRPSDAPSSGTIMSRSSSDRRFEEQGAYSELLFQKDYECGKNVKGTVTLGGNLEHWRLDNFYQGIRTTTSTFGEGIPLDLANPVEPPTSDWIYSDITRRRTRECDAGLFLTNKITFFDRLTVEGGARFDYYRRSQENLSNGNRSVVSDSAISPGAGISYRILGTPKGKDFLTAYANWGRGYFPVFRGGAGTAEIEVLDPETSQSYEFGLKGAAFDGRLSGNLALYKIMREDVVGYNPIAGKQENMGDWEVRGIEFDVRAKPVDWLELFGSYTWRCPDVSRNDGHPEYEGNQLVFVADQMFKLGAEFNHKKKLFIGADLQWTGETFADEANTITLDEHCEVNAHVSYKWDKFVFTFFVKNLFDEEYYSGVFNGVVNGSAFMGAPRTFGFSVAAKF